jgi:outer membrane protein OmpA-like peptidoglycan-associated protein
VKVAEAFIPEVIFTTNSVTISSDQEARLVTVARMMKSNPTLRWQVVGHADKTGSERVNLRIAERRAQSVIQYLVSKGISMDRISSKWYNEEKLAIPCGDGVPCPEADHQLNRRSELKLIAFPDSSQSYPLPKGATATDFQSREAAAGWFRKVN